MYLAGLHSMPCMCVCRFAQDSGSTALVTGCGCCFHSHTDTCKQSGSGSASGSERARGLCLPCIIVEFVFAFVRSPLSLSPFLFAALASLFTVSHLGFAYFLLQVDCECVHVHASAIVHAYVCVCECALCKPSMKMVPMNSRAPAWPIAMNGANGRLTMTMTCSSYICTCRQVYTVQ